MVNERQPQSFRERAGHVIGGAIGSLPGRLRGPVLRKTERFLPPDEAMRIADQMAMDPFLHRIVNLAERTELQEKPERQRYALQQLREQSRISLAVRRGIYPEVTGIPEVRGGTIKKRKHNYPNSHIHPRLRPVWESARPVIADITDFKDASARKINALLTPHPADGFPDEWYFRNPYSRFINFLPGTRHQSLDQVLLQKMYYDRTDRYEIHAELHTTFKKVADEQIPKMDQKALDRLRFLGFEKQEDFVNQTGQRLITEVEEMCAKFGMEPPEKLRDFMSFAFISDSLRNETRRTGETYFCHYLSSAWLLWTMIKDDIKSEDDLRRAVEDVEILFVHDIPEDLPHELSRTEEPEFRREKFPLSITVPGTDGRPVRHTVQLSRDQWLILKAVTKEPGDDNGAIWLQKIRTIHNPGNPDPADNATLRLRAARIKSADRLSNLLTMSAAGIIVAGEERKGFADTYGKLEETKRSGSKLSLLAHFGDLQPEEAIEKMYRLDAENRFEALVSSVMVIAEIEQRILLGKFAVRFQEAIENSTERWARHLLAVIKNEVISPGGIEEDLPVWQRRIHELMQCYLIPAEYSSQIIPASDLSKYIGLEHFALDPEMAKIKGPWEFKHFAKLVDQSHDFLRNFTPVKGVIPGGVEDVYIPVAVPESPLVTHTKPMTDAFIEEISRRTQRIRNAAGIQ